MKENEHNQYNKKLAIYKFRKTGNGKKTGHSKIASINVENALKHERVIMPVNQDANNLNQSQFSLMNAQQHPQVQNRSNAASTNQPLTPVRANRHSQSTLEGLYLQNLQSEMNQSLPFVGNTNIATMNPVNVQYIPPNPLQLPSSLLPAHSQIPFSYLPPQNTQPQGSLLSSLNKYSTLEQAQPMITLPQYNITEPNFEQFSNRLGNPSELKELISGFNNRKWMISTKQIDTNDFRMKFSNSENQSYFALINFKENEIHMLNKAIYPNSKQILEAISLSLASSNNAEQQTTQNHANFNPAYYNHQQNQFPSMFSPTNQLLPNMIPNQAGIFNQNLLADGGLSNRPQGLTNYSDYAVQFHMTRPHQ